MSQFTIRFAGITNAEVEALEQIGSIPGLMLKRKGLMPLFTVHHHHMVHL